jgi:AhpD family alkylhydroperoxidase
MGHWHDVQDALREPAKSLREAIPDVYMGFGQMASAAMRPGAIPGHIKELIALAIATAQQCDGCIAFHARAAARKGATREEVAESLGVVLDMTGGPGTVYGPRAWEAFLEFGEEE